MLEQLRNHKLWEEFYTYKEESGRLKDKHLEDLKRFIVDKEYESVLDQLSFHPPKKIYISKQGTNKKRIVYSYSLEENYILKLLTYLLQRQYDHIFSHQLYSFRPSKGAKDAIYRLTRQKNLSSKWVYKVDISDYFNSIPVPQLLEKLEIILKDDKDIYDFIAGLLLNPNVLDNGNIVEEAKGIMAGTPISTFLANVYLSDLDHHFKHKTYARYSDDIIIFASSKEELDEDIKYIKTFLNSHGLSINPSKESISKPNEPWIFLGCIYHNHIVDIAPVSIQKLKAKMKRKARALLRWSHRKNVDGKKAAKAFIRTFNKKLFENTKENELTWARWYFPLINTDVSLKVIDQYAQQCIRYIATGTYKKSSYNFRYEDMKELGYKTLLNMYYKSKYETPN